MPQNPPFRAIGAANNLVAVAGGIPTAPLATSIVVAGTAVVVATGPINGGFITNPYNAAAQGVGSAENLYVDCINTPGSTDAAGNGTTSIVQPGQTFTLAALPSGYSYRVNAASAGHKFTVNLWR